MRFRLNIRGQPIHRDAQQSELLTSSSSSGRARAAILVVARNEDCNGVLLSMQRMERRFKHKFQYPYVFLNNAPFSDLFRKRYVISMQHLFLSAGTLPPLCFSITVSRDRERCTLYLSS